MFLHKTPLVIGVLTVAAAASVLANRVASVPTIEQFEELYLNLEINTTDEDFGVVIAMEVAEAFLELVVHDPFDNVAFHLLAPGPEGMALTEVTVEAKRDDVMVGLADFPPGWYRVSARGIDGSTYRGLVELSHDLPTRTQIVQPEDGAVVRGGELEIRWGTSGDADHYLLEIEGDGLDLALELPAGITSFRLPRGILKRGTEYQLGVSAVNDVGNVVVHEIHVTTVAR